MAGIRPSVTPTPPVAVGIFLVKAADTHGGTVKGARLKLHAVGLIAATCAAVLVFILTWRYQGHRLFQPRAVEQHETPSISLPEQTPGSKPVSIDGIRYDYDHMPELQRRIWDDELLLPQTLNAR